MMYVDLILNLIKVKDAELLLWMNNCGPHKNTEVSDLFTKQKSIFSLTSEHDGCLPSPRPLR